MSKLIYILSFLVVIISISCSRKMFRSLPNNRGAENMTLESLNDSTIDTFRKEMLDFQPPRINRADSAGIIFGKEGNKVDEMTSDYDNRMNTEYRAFQYDNGDDYVRDGLYRIVDERGKIGYADENGNTVITPRFAFGFPFEDGKAKVTDCGQMREVEGSRGEYHYWESDNWYYIDKHGRKTDP